MSALDIPMVAVDLLIAHDPSPIDADVEHDGVEDEPQRFPTVWMDDAFWNARPILQHIRAAAHSRNRSAEALLMVTLARIAACSSHMIQLPPVVGAVGSLNMCVAIVGPSGAGKSTVVSIARELVPRSSSQGGVDLVDNVSLGSGEGLAELFMGAVEEPISETKTKKIRRQVAYNAFVYADEGETFTAMTGRTGATLGPQIRKAWVGQSLGQQNATEERTRTVGAHEYRMSIVMNFQPEKAAPLLADAVGGTPQRFLFGSAIDATVPDQPPLWPVALQIRWPGMADDHAVHHDGARRIWLTVPDWVQQKIRDEDRAAVRGVAAANELDSHSRLHILKAAGLLAIADGRLDITDEDWHLATTIWFASCAVRTSLQGQITRSNQTTEAQRVRQRADGESVIEAARLGAGDRVATYAKRLGKFAHNKPQPLNGWAKRNLLYQFKNPERVIFPEVLAMALTVGYLEETSEGRFVRGEHSPS